MLSYNNNDMDPCCSMLCAGLNYFKMFMKEFQTNLKQKNIFLQGPLDNFCNNTFKIKLIISQNLIS